MNELQLAVVHIRRELQVAHGLTRDRCQNTGVEPCQRCFREARPFAQITHLARSSVRRWSDTEERGRALEQNNGICQAS
eukprot:6204297-Pleurochrysis_carterae.AAC.6